MRVLGPLVHSYSVERAAARILNPDHGLIGVYLDETARQDRASISDPVDRLERPRAVRIRERVRAFSDDQLPALIIVSPGTIGPTRRDGEGNYSATWSLGVTAVTQSTGEDVGRETAAMLATAAADVLLHYLPRVDDRIRNVTWEAEATTDTPMDDARSRHACTRELHVTVEDVVSDFAGAYELTFDDPPLGDPALDTGDRQTVLTTGLEATPVENLP
jgi:hypothetical protein